MKRTSFRKQRGFNSSRKRDQTLWRGSKFFALLVLEHFEDRIMNIPAHPKCCKLCNCSDCQKRGGRGLQNSNSFSTWWCTHRFTIAKFLQNFYSGTFPWLNISRCKRCEQQMWWQKHINCTLWEKQSFRWVSEDLFTKNSPAAATACKGQLY